MLASIVGQASFHTAGPSGPSMIDRSYRRRSAAAGFGSFGLAVAGTGGAETSVIADNLAR
jgi:hypothetical protein